MANTTNFGWETPDDTDLVKDGAAAMRTLGNAIDTSFVDLKGGTTGQILSKASNTDLDYTWTSPNPGDITAVTAGTGLSGGGTSGDVTLTNTVATAYDAKGDLVVGTGADTFAKLSAGTNGYTLVANSAASTGLAWQEYTYQNATYNSAFNIWQRGTSVACTTGNTYTADRWSLYRGVTGGTVSRQTTGDTTNLPNIQYCARVQRDSGNTNTSALYFRQALETLDSIKFTGKTVVLSFYARKGSNFSATSDILRGFIGTGTGTDQSPISFTGEAANGDTNFTLTTTWQRFSLSATLPTTTTEIYLNASYTPTGTASTNDYFEITGVQLEYGSVPSPYHPQFSTIQAELAACQRYYFRNGGQSAYQLVTNGWCSSTTNVYGFVQFPVQMRTTPTSIDYASLRIDIESTGAAVSAVAFFGSEKGPLMVTLSFTTTGMVQYRPAKVITDNTTNGYLGLSAEL